MLALPIARRELLVLSRAPLTWKNRMGVSAVVLGAAILLSVFYHFGGSKALTMGMHFFGGMLSMMCLFAGVALTADSIAEEKRAGTIGLLFLTDLSPFEIVMGKLIAHGVRGFYTAICALPLLSMSMIVGGMRFSEVLMYMFSALNSLFCAAGVGLFASTICRDRKKAGSMGTLIILLFWMVLPAVAVVLGRVGASPALVNFITRISLNVYSPLSVGFSRLLPSGSLWWSMAWVQIMAWAFIGSAIWLLPRRWQDEPPKERRALRDFWKSMSLGTPETRLKLRQKLLDRNAFMWLASRERLQGLGIWLASLVVISMFALQFLSGRFQPEFLVVIGIALSVVQQVVFGAAAGTQLAREYEQGTLEMILSTPLTVREVIRGQLAAARRHHRSAFVFTFVLLWVGLLLLAIGQRGGRGGIIALAIYSGFFVLQFYAIGWVSLWFVVTAPDPRRAQGGAFFCLMILPLMMFGLIIGGFQFVWWLLSVQFPFVLAGIRFSPGPELMLPLLFLLGFGNCLYWLRRAKRELPGKLRLFAFRRYTPQDRQTFFGEIGKLLGRCWQRMRMRPLEPRITR
ncbi:MAG TPA: ABC transporter permease [Verrucomicrobiae bacterium]|nr:ABC transporter permease [Verrucomicrobiae bacterium]